MNTDSSHIALRGALPYPAGNLYDLQVSGYHDGLVTVSIDLPESMIYAFTALLDSLTDSFRFLQFKAKSVKAQVISVDSAVMDLRKEQFAAFEKIVLERYDKFVAAGSSSREAIRQTKAFFLSKDQYITCYCVELIIRPHGRLSKKKNRLVS